MFSVPDIGVISVLALLLFGPDKLPGMMRQAGKIVREVQNTSQSFVSEMERAADLQERPPVAPGPTMVDVTPESPQPETIEHQPFEAESSPEESLPPEG